MIGLRLLLAQYRAFWRFRVRLDDARLSLRRGGFTVRSRVAEEARSSSAVLYIARLTLYDLAIALGFSGGVWWASSRFSLFPSTDSSAYIELLSGVAQIGGVFIGLYYAAITAAMTAVYAQMPGTVSQLLMQERFGNAYMRFVATLTFTAINLLALHALGFPTGSIGIPVIAVGAGVAVFGFVKLGTWAFKLFDPTAVSHVVFRDSRELLRQVVVGGYQWQSAAFQQFAQRRCAHNLRTLEELADACEASKYLRDEPLVHLAASTLALAGHSIEQCPRIPTKSLWFAPVYSQPDWYRTSDDQTSIAHHTGTSLQPHTVQDRWWVEQRCQEIALKALRSLLDRRQMALARTLASAFESHVDTLARHGCVREAVEITNRLEDAIVPAMIDVPPGSGEHLVDRVALLDYIGRLRVTCVLRAADWADQVSRERLQLAIDGVDWLQSVTPYVLGLHAHSLEQAEWLAQRLSFERMAIGRVVTPSWYCGELLAQKDADALSGAVTGLCRDVLERMWGIIDRTLDNKKLWEATCLLSDALHYVRKLQHHLGRFQRAMTRISGDRRIQELPWPDSDFRPREAYLADQYVKVIERMANLVPLLPERPQALPDYPGQFLHAATEEVFQSVVNGDAEALARFFPATFVGCLAKHNALRPSDLTPDDPRVEGTLSVALAPIMDVIELSGLSYLLSEVFPERNTWSVIGKVWDKFLDSQQQFEHQLLAMIRFSHDQFFIGPRSLLRTNWKQRVLGILAQLPTRSRGRGFGMQEEIDHPSAFVRCVVQPGSFGLMYDGADIFAATYLLARPGANRGAAHRASIELAQWLVEDKQTVKPDEESNEDV